MSQDYTSFFGTNGAKVFVVELTNSEAALYAVLKLVEDGGQLNNVRWPEVTVQWRTLTAITRQFELVVHGVGARGTAAINTATILHELFRRYRPHEGPSDYLQRLLNARPAESITF